MKNLNVNDNMRSGLLSKIVQFAGNKIENIPIDPHGCWVFVWYEPEIPTEILENTSSS